MRERTRATLAELRTAISCLPRATRIAMLEGIAGNEIVVGAYTHQNGICPMLAAHRNGARTSFISFAEAWDRFAFQGSRSRSRKARVATARELLILRSHLEASLLEDDGPAADLRSVIGAHRQLRKDRRESQVEPEPASPARQGRREEPVHASPGSGRPGDRERNRELRVRLGSGWMPVLRRHYEHQRARGQVRDQPGGAAEDRVVRDRAGV